MILIDWETYEVLGFQRSTWDAQVDAHEAKKAERVIRGNVRAPVPRPIKCLGCGKPLVQDLGSRVRHYCNRKCQRTSDAANRSDPICRCGKVLTNGRRVWCSDRCRNQHRAAVERGEPICKCGKPIPKGSRVWCSPRCRKSQPEFKERANTNRKAGRKRNKSLDVKRSDRYSAPFPVPLEFT